MTSHEHPKRASYFFVFISLKRCHFRIEKSLFSSSFFVLTIKASFSTSSVNRQPNFVAPGGRILLESVGSIFCACAIRTNRQPFNSNLQKLICGSK